MNLATYRNLNKMSQSDVAKLLGISKSSYGHYETGRNMIPLDKLIKLSDIYSVPLQALIGNMETDKDYSIKILAAAYRLKKKEVNRIKQFLELDSHKREKILKSFDELTAYSQNKETEKL